MVASAWDSFFKFAMTLNMKPGKTEVMIHFGGPRSELARNSLNNLPIEASTGCPLAACGNLHGGPVSVRFVTKHIHMGKRCGTNANQTAELVARHGSTLPYADRLTWQISFDC